MGHELDNSGEKVGGALPSEQVDLLVSRLVDGVAEPGEWERFGVLAKEHPTAWKTLAVAQHQQAALQQEFDRRLSSVHTVEVGAPREGARGGELIVRDADGRERIPTWSRLSVLGMWGGWLAAAGVALAWAAGRPLPLGNADTRSGGSTAGLGSAINPASWTINTPDDALNAYLKVGAEQNRVLGEVPGPVLVSSRPADSGRGFEVVFVRRFVERAVVDDMNLVRFGQDELGRKVPVPVVVPVSSGRGE